MAMTMYLRKMILWPIRMGSSLGPKIRNFADFEIIFEKKNLRFSLNVGTRLIACDMWMIFMKSTSLETKLTREEMTMRYMNQSKPWGTQALRWGSCYKFHFQQFNGLGGVGLEDKVFVSLLKSNC
ncbi:hypothetical protein ACSBR2_017167 [Camellia fascicularis]